jgi:hypothetical protein
MCGGALQLDAARKRPQRVCLCLFLRVLQLDAARKDLQRISNDLTSAVCRAGPSRHRPQVKPIRARMRRCDRIPRHDAQALGAFACVSGPVGEARSSVGRCGRTDWSGRPLSARTHAAALLGGCRPTRCSARRSGRSASSRRTTRSRARPRRRHSPPPLRLTGMPLPVPGMPVLALCRRRASCAPKPASSPPRPTRTHARTHAVWLQSQKRTELELLAQAMRQARPPPKSPHLRACHSLR